MRAQTPRAQRCLQRLDKLVDTLSGLGRNRNALGKAPAIDQSQLRVFQKVDFVEDNERLFAERVEFFNDAIDCCHLVVCPWMTEIDYVNEKIRLAHLFERSLERFYKSMWQFTQESDSIGKQNPLLVRKHETARRRIEGRKKFIDCEDIGTCHQI